MSNFVKLLEVTDVSLFNVSRRIETPIRKLVSHKWRLFLTKAKIYLFIFSLPPPLTNATKVYGIHIFDLFYFIEKRNKAEYRRQTENPDHSENQTVQIKYDNQ